MSLAAGTISATSTGSNTVALSGAGATGGTPPYIYQWYRSLTTGFTPGPSNAISGATSLQFTDSGLIPNTTYYYVLVATDATTATANSTQLTVVTTATQLNPNVFQQSPVLGQIDMRFPFNTVAAQVDTSQSTALYQGSAVKMVDSADGVPKVVGCSANSDEVLGFINFDIKSVSFLAGDRVELSLAGNVIYLYATGAISRGVQVSLDLSSPGSVRSAAGNTGDDIVGWAFDKAAAAGALIRVFLKTPSFLKV